MEIIVYILLGVNAIQAIGCLYIIYRLALIVKAKDLYEVKSFHEKDEKIEEDLSYDPNVGPITSNLFADVTPTR